MIEFVIALLFSGINDFNRIPSVKFFVDINASDCITGYIFLIPLIFEMDLIFSLTL
jgi:hypothetical protein